MSEVEEKKEYGVKETKEVMTMMAGLVKTGEAAMVDGKITFEDAGHLMIAAPSIGPAVDGISMVPAELADMTEAEEKEVEQHIDEQFGEGTYQLIGEDLLQGSIHFASALAKIKGLK